MYFGMYESELGSCYLDLMCSPTGDVRVTPDLGKLCSPVVKNSQE